MSAFSNKFGCRAACICGSIIGTIAFILSMFAPSSNFMMLTYGFMGGKLSKTKEKNTGRDVLSYLRQRLVFNLYAFSLPKSHSVFSNLDYSTWMYLADLAFYVETDVLFEKLLIASFVWQGRGASVIITYGVNKTTSFTVVGAWSLLHIGCRSVTQYSI